MTSPTSGVSSGLSIINSLADFEPILREDEFPAHRIEFELTLRTVVEYLPTDRKAKILDVGCGDGPYSFALAGLGHDATHVDVSPGLLSLAHSRIAQSQGGAAPSGVNNDDVLELASLLPEDEMGTFDAVLLFGALNQIMSAPLRVEAIRQAWATLRPGGTLFCAWTSRWSVYRQLAARAPHLLAREYEFNHRHSSDGDYIILNRNGNISLALHHEDPANMPVILQEVTGQPATMVGLDGVLAGGQQKFIEDLDGDEFEAWISKCFEVGMDEMGWMMSDHIMGVVCKPPTITISSPS